MIKKFTILGERCSGTNYLEELLLANFDISVTWEYGWKHFFGKYDFKKTENENETLFIGIVRHPVEWLNSFFKNQHHVPNAPRPIHNFLFDNFYSICKNEQTDMNIFTNKKYKNIFELRFLKNYYLLNSMPNNVQNYILITYENLRDNTASVLDLIQSKFNLTKRSEEYKNITYYKKEKNKFYSKKSNMVIPPLYQKLCTRFLNKQQEQRLGYNTKIIKN